MPDLILPSGLAVVLLGLASSASWGTSDFAGGLTSRRAPVFGVLLVTQGIGLVVAAALATAGGEPAILPGDLGWSILCGLLGGAGLFGLYAGLARGRMSVVAPVTGLVGTTVPVVGALLLEGLPGPQVLAGIGLGIAAILLVSVVAESDPDRPTGLPYAVFGGLSLGLFSLAIAQVSDEYVFRPLIVVRGVEAVLFTTLILLARRPWRVGRPLWAAMVLIGCLDMFGNAFYIAATHAGALAIAVTLSSLYPVVTAILAAVFLRERITVGHGAGILAAAVAIALIAGGSA